MRFYNPRAHIVPMVAGCVAFLYLLLSLARPLLDRVSRLGLAIGRFSLGAYVLHLGLVALPVLVAGRRYALRSGWAATGWLLLVIFGCQLYALFRTSQVELRAR